MKTKPLFLTVLVWAAIGFMGSHCQAQDKEASQVVLDNIATRVSVRSYLDKPVEDAKIEQMLRAAMAAPTAMNRQPWHFVVINDKVQLKALGGDSPRGEMFAKAPLAIVVCGDMDKAFDGPVRDFWIEDCSAATENLLLAAHALGLGAVWTGLYPDTRRCQAIADIIGLPETMIPLCTVVIGYPAGENTPKDKWKPENISYNRFGEGKK